MAEALETTLDDLAILPGAEAGIFRSTSRHGWKFGRLIHVPFLETTESSSVKPRDCKKRRKVET